jgi:hypothetical protein
MKKLLAGLAILALWGGLFAVVGGTAGADEDGFSFKVGYQVKRGKPGTSVQIGAAKVPIGLQGRTCTVSLMSENNSSLHPKNDVIVRSGGDSVTFPNVEMSKDAQTFEGASPLTLGVEVLADMRFGSDGVTSSGFVLTIECLPPPTTTTVPATTVPPTTEPPVTTTVPPTTEPPVTVPPTTVKPPPPPVVVVKPPTVVVVAPPAPTVEEVPLYNG